VFLDGQGHPLEGLHSIPEQVLMTVQIGRTYFTRVVAIQASIKENTLEQDYEITQISIEPPTVTLVGSSSALEKAGDFLVTAPISLTNVYGELNLQVPLIIPDGLSTLDEKSENVNNVKVTISIRGKTAYLVLTTKVKVINLSTSFRVQAEASEVSVLLIGPKPLLDEIQKNPELITASLDLDKLTAGAYTIPIQIRIPQGVQAQLFPAEAQVVIQ
jgi:YbbR domain-containing protein